VTGWGAKRRINLRQIFSFYTKNTRSLEAMLSDGFLT
jgi:hypothetical protein